MNASHHSLMLLSTYSYMLKTDTSGNQSPCDVTNSRSFPVSASDTSAGSVTHLSDIQMAADAAETAPRSVKHGWVCSVTQSVSQPVSKGLNGEFRRSLSSPWTDGIQRKTSDCRSAFLFFFFFFFSPPPSSPPPSPCLLFTHSAPEPWRHHGGEKKTQCFRLRRFPTGKARGVCLCARVRAGQRVQWALCELPDVPQVVVEKSRLCLFF